MSAIARACNSGVREKKCCQDTIIIQALPGIWILTGIASVRNSRVSARRELTVLTNKLLVNDKITVSCPLNILTKHYIKH